MISPDAFQAVILPLAVATNRVLDDEALTVYHDGLQDVPMPTLQAAVGRLIASSRFFPTVGEIRAACDRLKARDWTPFSVPLPPKTLHSDDDPRSWYACPICQDSGWASHWCKGSINAEPPAALQFQSVGVCGSRACARFGERGYGHEYVRRCACYEHNPNIRARLEARKRYAGEST